MKGAWFQLENAWFQPLRAFTVISWFQSLLSQVQLVPLPVDAACDKNGARKRSSSSPDSSDHSPAKQSPLAPTAKSMKRKESEGELLTISHDVIDEIDTADKKHLKNMGLMTGLAIGGAVA